MGRLLGGAFLSFFVSMVSLPQVSLAREASDERSFSGVESNESLGLACDGFEDEHLAIDGYLAERWDAPASATDDLVAALAGVSVECVEEMIRAGRRVPVPAPHARGVIHELSVTCEHVDYSSDYYLYVPPSYVEGVPTPLVAIGHGGNGAMSQSRANSTARSYMTRYMAYAQAPLNAILVAPATRHGWNQAGYSLLFSTISKTKSEYTIDPDRVYVSGQSMGGHLSWRAGYLFPDRWGAVAPQSGGYTSWVEEERLRNFFNLPGYTTWGQTELYGLDDTNEALAAWLSEHEFGWITTEVPGHHPIDAASQPLITQFFVDNPRNLYPCATHYHLWGPLVLNNPAPVSIIEGREYWWNTQRWLEVEPAADTSTRVSIHAEIDGNTVHVDSNNVRRFSIYTHPELFDLTTPITVVVNGDVLFSGLVPVDLGLMLETVREYDDRGRIFHGKVDIDVTTDVPVPPPVGDDTVCATVDHSLLRAVATATAPVTPPLEVLLPLDPVRDAVLPDFVSGDVDPDAGSFPLVFYGLSSDLPTLRVVKTGAGDVRITW
ncbi:MAG: alpha/beta hydrolase-fold protein [Acidobacteriota bacterium]